MVEGGSIHSLQRKILELLVPTYVALTSSMELNQIPSPLLSLLNLGIISLR